MQHFIGYRMFAALDSRATDEQERFREKVLRLEFTKLVPAAGRLRASELVLQRHHSPLGCRLEYYLAPTPQASFDFTGSGESAAGGTNDLADFEADVAKVSADCANVRTRLVLAHSPALGHQELAQNTAATLDIKALRSLFRRRKRQVVLPTPNGELLFDLPPVPKHLPTAFKGSLTAHVARLSPSHTAILRQVAWELTPLTTQRPTLPASLSACRLGLSHEDSIRLLQGMDEKKALTLVAEIVFDWASGASASVKLLAVLRESA
ncbi:hypothetical protein [Inhella gelatinilytica]|uniref:Uncharacterized protein n=1 Tax=Inhella gelatinilytica TaxID=2795030 RepID=A0A931J0J4_9BURK|nr:hypothetical protein [Inhella gelatinilytica]MBH9553948.1 hypothetical protein [Inhella gelatinilytica]